MNTTISFQKLKDKKQIIVIHSYKNEIEILWDAFTKTEILEKWWAPEPYKAIVVSNHFENGGQLFYYMLSPTGEKHYCIAAFSNIIPYKSYNVFDAFTDENATINTALPRIKWQNTFASQDDITTVTNILNFDALEEMNQLLEMGFEQGYSMGLNQLFELLK
jgi:uncharacterized protein YndB with AHSA1/START domain